MYLLRGKLNEILFLCRLRKYVASKLERNPIILKLFLPFWVQNPPDEDTLSSSSSSSSDKKTEDNDKNGTEDHHSGKRTNVLRMGVSVEVMSLSTVALR